MKEFTALDYDKFHMVLRWLKTLNTEEEEQKEEQDQHYSGK